MKEIEKAVVKAFSTFERTPFHYNNIYASLSSDTDYRITIVRIDRITKELINKIEEMLQKTPFNKIHDYEITPNSDCSLNIMIWVQVRKRWHMEY